jgi:hypothetical protein
LLFYETRSIDEKMATTRCDGVYQDGVVSPHLYLDRFVFLVYKITRHKAIAMYTVIVDISRKKVCL